MTTSHALDIIKPGRGVWIAMCRCGHSYKHPQTTSGNWPISEVNERAIRALHREHKKGSRA